MVRAKKKALTETDIRTTFLTPALVGQNEDNWNVKTPICKAVRFMKDRVIVRGKSVQRGKA